MTTQPFSIEDLMDILEQKAGLPAPNRTGDLTMKFTDIGLDSLAFLSVQATLETRYGFELTDEGLQHRPFADIVSAVNERLRGADVA